MSTNGSSGLNSCEDTEMAECDGEKVVTMMDVLKEQEDFEEDANAVLGASDDKNCTYSKGYIKRQAIYACMTCCAEAKDDPTKRAGVCLACSLTCHENHDLVELYTKRNFRCDCGNPKFNSHPCQFTPEKTDLNEENIYNQNFSGVYCTCHRPYPDPESPTDQEMIQCIICEDWLHSSHLDAVVPPNELYSEMICKACMDRNEFLHDYSELVVNKEDEDVDILNTTSELNGTTKVNGNVDTDMLVDENIDSNAQSEKCDSLHNDKQGADVDTNVESKTVAEETKEIEQSDDTKPECVTEKVQENSDSQTVANEGEQLNERTSESDNVTSEKDTEKSDKEPELCSAESTMDTESKEKNDLSEEIKPTSETIDNHKEEKQTEQTNLDETSDQTSDSKNEKDSEGVTPTSGTTAAQEEVPTPMETSDSPTPAVENATLLEINENPDSRTQEQVEEDLLLADPVDANSAENKATSSDSITSSDEVTKENKSESQSMDVNESEKTATDNIEKEKCEQQETVSVDTELTKNNADIQEQSSSNEGENTADVISETENKEETIEETNDTENKENKTNVNEIEKTSETENEENKTDVNEIENKTEVTNTLEIEKNDIKDTSARDVEKATAEILKRKLTSETDSEDSTIKKPKLDGIQCSRPKGVKKIYKGATFWPTNFRNKLCTCNECISMYKDLSVLFLTDPEDTVTAYERLGKEKTDGKPVSQYEKGMAALSSLGHVQQINALTEYGKMRDKLLEFLKSFKDRKVIVKEEDIKAFFASMKPVREPDGVYFCR